MRYTRLLFLLALLVPCSPGAAGTGDQEIRQSTGIFVTVNHRAHSLYLDYPATRTGGEGTDRRWVPVTLTTDVDLWVGRRPLPAGRHSWTLDLDSRGGWTIGVKGGESRYFLSLGEAAPETKWLQAAFRPDPAEGTVVLVLRYGKTEGTLRFSVGTDPAADGGGDDASPVSGRLFSVRNQLRAAAGILRTSEKRRPLWSALLAELGTALVEGPGQGHLTEAALETGSEQATFVVRGAMPGGRDAVEEVARRFSGGAVAKLFEHVGRPMTRGSADGPTFEITAASSLERWNRSRPLDALAKGDDPKKLAEEILFLEARLDRLCGDTISSVSELPSRLLPAKREAGVIISDVTAGDPIESANGLTRLPVTIKVAGWGPGIVRFVRALEEWEVPLTLDVTSMKAGEFSPEAVIEVAFYDYVPLEKRDKALSDVVRKTGGSADFQARCELYLKGVGERLLAPFTAPDWKRDPFDVPRKSE